MTGVKREAPSDDDYDEGSSVTKSPKKRKARTAWTAAEDEVLINAAKAQMKAVIWNLVKNDPAVKERGSNGVAVRMGVLMNRLSG